jgi:hypothetical protein
MNLENTLKKISKKIWKELKPVNDLNINIHNVREEALSSMGLKILANSKCDNILRIEMISSHQEALRGYDYEICIGSSQKRKFIRFFIQAKRLYGNKLNSRYNAYDANQSKVLEDYSKTYKGIPLYSLYNHLDVPTSELLRYYNSTTNFDKKHLGVTLATTTKLKGGNQFNSIHDNGILNYFRLPFYRYHPLDMEFYEDNIQVGVPLHELANFTVEKAEEFNRRNKQNNSRNILPFFFFFFDPELLSDDSGDLIPILGMSEEELVADFRKRTELNNNNKEGYNPQSIIIIEQEDLYE